MLTPRQQLTIQHLKDLRPNITPIQIIEHCVRKQLQKRRFTDKRGKRHRGKRRHSVQYYREIINYLAQNTNRS